MSTDWKLLNADHTDDVLSDIRTECGFVDARFGEQNWLLSFGPGARAAARIRERSWKAENEQRTLEKSLAWDGIILEEVFEAIAEEDPHKAREELVQVAAMAVKAIMALDRAAAKTTESCGSLNCITCGQP